MYLVPNSEPLFTDVLNPKAVCPLDGRALSLTIVLLMAMPAVLAIFAPAAAVPEDDGAFPHSLTGPFESTNVTVESIRYPKEVDPYDYSDVLVLINNNSAMSKQVGEYFAQARGVPAKHVAYLDVPAREVITKDQYEDLEDQVKTYLLRNNLVSAINYIVTTKGFPLKITNSSNWYRACVDEELALIYGPSEGSIGNFAWVMSPYYGKRDYFDRNNQGIYLVNRLTGYDWDDVKGLIDRANDTYGNRGRFVLDVDPSKGYSTSGYGVGNLWLRNARDILVPRGEDVFFDETRWYVTGQTDVIGYSSWGSNDANDTDHAKPKNSWVNGSIAETFVSTGGRTFTYPPRYGQSMIADIIAENVTGVKGYVYEPYLSAIAHPDTLFERYTAGFNLAESYRMASVYLGWMGVVVGDPKCSPYRDIPDLATSDDLLVPGNATPATEAMTHVTLQVRNMGGKVDDANLTLYVDGEPWVADSMTFETFSLTTLNISFRAPDVPGGYEVKVVLNDPLGFFETLYDNNEAVTHLDVQERPVVVLTVSNPSPLTLDSIRFDLRVASTPRHVTLYYFDFDDGTEVMVLQSNSTFHSFEDDGVYNVTAWVVDEGSVLSLVSNVTVRVGNRAPLPLIRVTNDTLLTGESFEFHGNESSDLDGHVVSLVWNLGDGNTSEGWTVVHAFRWPGEYVVRLTVTDDDDAFTSVTRRVTVLNRRPVASFVLDDEEVWRGRTASLNASTSADPDGVIAQYEWDFGDGTEGEVTRTPVVHHVFESAGEVTVTLIVVDDLGASDQVEMNVTVLNMLPEASLGIDPGTVLTGDEVTLDGSRSFDPDGSIVDLEFTVLDGTGEVVGLFAGTLEEHPWFPEDDGVYTVVLNVTDDDGAWVEVEGDLTVLNRPPEVVLDEATGDLFGSVLEAPSTLVAGVLAGDDDGEVTAITWMGGEPLVQVAEGASVTIPLDTEGALSLLVTVVDDDGAQASTWLNLTVNEPPVARLAVSVEGEDVVDAKVREKRMLTFDGSNSSDPGGIARFQWDFGDGFTQDGSLVSHAFGSAGSYTVTLKVTDDHGATDQITYEVRVVEEPSPAVSGISGTILALVIVLVVAVVTVTAYVLWRRGQEERDGGEEL
jgi:uncharacterized protein (TIGR03790 family)